MQRDFKEVKEIEIKESLIGTTKKYKQEEDENNNIQSAE